MKSFFERATQEDSINNDLKQVIIFLKSLIVKEIGKQSWEIWNKKTRRMQKHYFSIVECQEIEIDRKFGSLRVYRDIGKYDNFFIEAKNLVYSFPPDMLKYVTDKLLKVVK